MKDLKSLKHIIQELYYILNKKQKRQFIGIILLIIGGSFFELLGVSAFIPFIQVVSSPDAAAESPLFKPIAFLIGDPTSANMMPMMMGILIAIYVIKNLYLMMSNYFQIRFRCQFQKDLSKKMLITFLKRPYIYFVETNSVKITRGIGSDVSGVYNVLQHISRILAELFTCALIGIFIFWLDPVMAAGVFVIGFIVMILIIKVMKTKLGKMGIKLREVSVVEGKYASQAIMGNKESRVMNRTQFFVDAYAKAAAVANRINITYNCLLVLPERIIEVVCISGIFFMVGVSYQLGDGGLGFIEKLAALAVAAFRVLPSISRLTTDFNGIIFNKAAMESTYENLKEVEAYEISQRKEKQIVNQLIDPNYKFQDVLSVNNISWKYPTSSKYVLHNTGLSIKKGESIGIIGASGAGKSTLTDIILGLLHPQEGSVQMDGIDISTIPMQWSKNVGYVPQSVYLTDDSIANNVAFGIEEKDIDEEKVWKALEQAMVLDFVKSLPNGIHTRVGQRGAMISGGQRQRIAIARALYYDPDIFIFDEATAALDNETETELMQSIESLQGVKTMIIVAHRLTTIKKCDKIFEVINGSIIERTKEEVFG